MNSSIHPSSFRDPSGSIFTHGGKIFRQVNSIYKDNYDQLMGSGLYKALVDEGLLIPHEEVTDVDPPLPGSYKILQPDPIPFISYPYEWSFGQLKDAALTTLKIVIRALEFGMVLKDASAYNIQFFGSRPVFIDTLSFELYSEGEPWAGYKQFCQHFLAPLALMKYTDVRLSKLLHSYIDGIPLDLASSILPMSTKIKPALLTHIHMHSKYQEKYGGKGEEINKGLKISLSGLTGILESLNRAISGLVQKEFHTEWGAYYSFTNYNKNSFDHKHDLVESFLKMTDPGTVLDLGGNIGEFSRIASNMSRYTVSLDIDPNVVEQNYLKARKDKDSLLLPLLQDLTNPSASLGWGHEERSSLSKRGSTETVMALALVHHIAISNNVPLSKIAEWFSILGEFLIIEFVPKEDSQVKILLSSREDIFPEYHAEGFEKAFGDFYTIIENESIKDSKRILYLMRRSWPD